MPVKMKRTLQIHNGDKLPSMFSEAEMEARLGRLRAHMANAGIDAALFTSIHNIIYFNHFVYCAFGRPYGLIVTQDTVQSITTAIDGGHPWRRGYGDNLSFTDWRHDNFVHALQTAPDHCGRIGLECNHLTVERFRQVQAALPNAELVNIDLPAMQLRMLKSAEELALIRAGAAVADIGGTACVEAIDEGVPEHEVALHATGVMVREIAHRYPDSDLMDTWT
jgi:creatinase